MNSLPPLSVAGKLTARRYLGACGVARVAVLALWISALCGAFAQAAFAEEPLPDARVAEMLHPPTTRRRRLRALRASTNLSARAYRRSSRLKWRRMVAQSRMSRMPRRAGRAKSVKGWVTSISRGAATAGGFRALSNPPHVVEPTFKGSPAVWRRAR